MKNYENRFRYYLNRRIPTILRLDGRSFHTLTRKCVKPFDFNLIGDMQGTMKFLCREIDGCVLGYTQSDEISLLLIDYKRHDTQGWFDYNLQKIVSLAASMATGYFNSIRKYDRIAQFDCRAFQLADPDEVGNYFTWRVRDWNRNSVSMLAQSLYSHKKLHKKNVAEMQEMCFQKGCNWADQPNVIKNGTFYLREDNKEVVEQWDYRSWIRNKAEYSNWE